ncbi:AMP-binding enzyme [Colletotrichum tofieldiae]|nr:AMP-binding enzyme [Colletotrichum tofieldiae]
MFTPALLKQCLAESPSTIKGLELLFASGDRLDVQDALTAQALAKGGIINALGHTENTVYSTAFHMQPGELCINGVPVGRAISNSGALVLDPQQRLVPLGVMGELVLTGDGVARGYTDPKLNQGRFVEVTVDGETMRAYRTGDRARYRPSDAQMEFFGRMDQQVKIRGFRVEPAEVEQVLLRHPAVRDAAIVIRKQEDHGVEMVGFIAARDEQFIQDAQNEVSSRVEGWGNHFETSTYVDIEKIDQSVVGNDFMGWTSMYDGTEIDKGEMQEWLDDTMATILDSQPAGRVLEIGTGSGMILFNLGEGLESYVGLDPSASAVSFVRNRIQSVAAVAGKAQVYVATASDVAGLDGLQADLVVTNSVAQYFPTAEYLLQVVENLINIPGVKRLVFGDMRSWAINHDFLAARALRSLGPAATKNEIRRKIRELEEREEEFLVDPAFFTALTSRFDRIWHVEVLPKRMKAKNELSAYRYQAIVHVRGPDERIQQPAHVVDAEAWIDFKVSHLDRSGLLSLLQGSPDAQTVAISNVPYSRTIVERLLVESLDNLDDPGSMDGAAWIASIHEKAEQSVSLSPFDLVQLGKEAGFRVEFSCARQRSQHGAFDAVFHRFQAVHKNNRVLIQFPTEDQGRSPGSLTSRPLQRAQSRKVEAQIREYLQALLPPYMIPTQITALDQLPVNANGKVDRRELGLRAQTAPRSRTVAARVAPRNEVEAILCEEFADVLGVEVGITDNFFDLGGHSLMATKLAARLTRRLEARVSVKNIFDQPVLGDLAATVQQGSKKHNLIPSQPYNGPVEQSFGQGRIWFLHQLELGDSSGYHMPIAVRMSGPLQIDALRTALDALVQRHETLRTTFEEHDGVGVQIVQPVSYTKELRIFEVPDGRYEEIQRQEQARPFDLSTEPGWRVALIRLGTNDHVISIIMHHIISDGWSFEVLQRELTAFYAAALRGQDPLSQVSPLPIQYRDFAAWEKEDLQVAEHERQLAYWKQELAGSQPATLLCDKPRPATLSGNGGLVELYIEGPVYDSLQAFCRTYQATSFAVLLAAFRAAHYRLTGDDDVTLGTPIANRNRSELEDLIGFFVNTQCMRIAVDDDQTFDGLVRQVRSTVTSAFENQDVPFERVVSALLPGSRDTSRNPLVQLIFAVHTQQDIGKIQLEGLTGKTLPFTPTTRFDLEFHLFQEEDRLRGTVFYSTDLFEARSVQTVVDVFQEVLRQSLNKPQAPIAGLPLTDGLPALRSLGLLQANKSDYPRDSSVVDLFAKQVSAQPEAIAVRDTASQLTYAQLNEQSNQLAGWLRQRKLPPGSLVGVLAPRSCETIVALLAILKANLAYLPFDTNVPTARLEDILSEVSGDKLMLIGATVSMPDLKLPGVKLVRIIDALSQPCPAEPNAITGPHATSLAYVMFTSGSTGRPKGVMIEHRSIVRLVTNTHPHLQVKPGASMAHVSNLAFDATTWEIYSPLINGGTIVCLDQMTVLSPSLLCDAFRTNSINMAFFTTALLRQFLEEMPSLISNLDVLLTGGETMRSQDAFKARELVRQALCHVYGPTENTTYSTMYIMGPEERCVNGLPIGRALRNSGAYVMDSRQQLVPLGVIGELVVTGDGLARGYTDPSLDLHRFVQVTIDGQSVRAYRTGDRARYRPADGEIEFIGRTDNQVKIRGYRIETAEVEQSLAGLAGVRDSAIVIRKFEDQLPEMVGFVTVNTDIQQEQGENEDGESAAAAATNVTERNIRQRLQAILPSYMVPAQIIVVDHLPLNANGKVDRRELVRRALTTLRTSTVLLRVAPRDEVEAALCEEYAKVLGIEVGITDNFFDLGGHSLMATKLAARISRRLDARVSVKDIFDQPVLVDLAAIIRPSSALHSPITPMPYYGPVEQSFAQAVFGSWTSLILVHCGT